MLGDYAAAGKAVADSAAKTFAVQRKTGPDYGRAYLKCSDGRRRLTENSIAAAKAAAKVSDSRHQSVCRCN